MYPPTYEEAVFSDLRTTYSEQFNCINQGIPLRELNGNVIQNVNSNIERVHGTADRRCAFCILGSMAIVIIFFFILIVLVFNLKK